MVDGICDGGPMIEKSSSSRVFLVDGKSRDDAVDAGEVAFERRCFSLRRKSLWTCIRMRRRSSSLTPSACVLLERLTSQRVTFTNCKGSMVTAAASDVLSDSGRKMRVFSRTDVLRKESCADVFAVVCQCRMTLPIFAYQGASLIDRRWIYKACPVASPSCRHQHDTNPLVCIFAYSPTSDNACN